MESSVQQASLVRPNPNARLQAAHSAITKYLAVLSARSPAATAFRVDTAAPIYFDHDGRKAAVSLFDLHTLADGLMKTRHAYEVHRGTAGVTLHMTPTGMHVLGQIREATPSPARTTISRQGAPATILSRESLSAEKMMARVRARASAHQQGLAASAQPVPQAKTVASTFKDETATGRFLLPLMRSMRSGSKTAEEMLRSLCRVSGVAFGASDIPYRDTGATLIEIQNNCLRFLIASDVVTTAGRSFGLTLKGREMAALGNSPVDAGFCDPQPGSGVEEVPPAKTAQTVRREMSETEMLAMLERLENKTPFQILVMWRNAIRVLGDASRTEEHLQAGVLLRGVQEKWAQQTADGDVRRMFRWPETEARAARSGDADHSHFENLESIGMLAYLGYKVGNDGLSANVRQTLLSEVFVRGLPPAFQREYMEQWGEPSSEDRLHKIADCIAAFARNAARKDADFSLAIRHWEEDLQYLRERHYVGTFGFSWPADAGQERGLRR